MGRHGPLAECWCCGNSGLHHGRGLCLRCYSRWQGRGFTGAGPGPEFMTQAQKAAEYARIITSLPSGQAAEQLGVTRRTITRYRKALREVAS